MIASIIGVIVRQILTAVGSAGLIEADGIEQLVSAISIIISIVWSIIEKRNRIKS